MPMRTSGGLDLEERRADIAMPYDSKVINSDGSQQIQAQEEEKTARNRVQYLDLRYNFTAIPI